MTRTPVSVTFASSPNKPRPAGAAREIADGLARIEKNYNAEGSGPGSRFEGRLLEDVQAEWVMSHHLTILGALPNSDLYDIYRTEAGEFITSSGIGQGGSGSDPSIPPCQYCGAYGGGGHGGGCPIG